MSITRRVDNALFGTDADQLPARLQKQVNQGVDQQAVHAVIRGAAAQADAYEAHVRVEAAAFVTSTALSLASRLSKEEEHHAIQSPHAAGRYQVLVDRFTMLAADEVTQLGRIR